MAENWHAKLCALEKTCFETALRQSLWLCIWPLRIYSLCGGQRKENIVPQFPCGEVLYGWNYFLSLVAVNAIAAQFWYTVILRHSTASKLVEFSIQCVLSRNLVFLRVVDAQGRTCWCRLPWGSLFLPAEIAGHIVSHVVFLVLVGFSFHPIFQNRLSLRTGVPLYFITYCPGCGIILQ